MRSFVRLSVTSMVQNRAQADCSGAEGAIPMKSRTCLSRPLRPNDSRAQEQTRLTQTSVAASQSERRAANECGNSQDTIEYVSGVEVSQFPQLKEVGRCLTMKYSIILFCILVSPA